MKLRWKKVLLPRELPLADPRIGQDFISMLHLYLSAASRTFRKKKLHTYARSSARLCYMPCRSLPKRQLLEAKVLHHFGVPIATERKAHTRVETCGVMTLGSNDHMSTTYFNTFNANNYDAVPCISLMFLSFFLFTLFPSLTIFMQQPPNIRNFFSSLIEIKWTLARCFFVFLSSSIGEIKQLCVDCLKTKKKPSIQMLMLIRRSISEGFQIRRREELNKTNSLTPRYA